MLSPETLELYRKMTPSQRLELTFSMMEESQPWLLCGSAEQVARKIERIDQDNQNRNRALLTQLSLSSSR